MNESNGVIRDAIPHFPLKPVFLIRNRLSYLWMKLFNFQLRKAIIKKM